MSYLIEAAESLAESESRYRQGDELRRYVQDSLSHLGPWRELAATAQLACMLIPEDARPEAAFIRGFQIGVRAQQLADGAHAVGLLTGEEAR